MFLLDLFRIGNGRKKAPDSRWFSDTVRLVRSDEPHVYIAEVWDPKTKSVTVRLPVHMQGPDPLKPIPRW